MRASLAGEEHPGRRPEHDETAARVGAVDERVEAPAHERVVERADREERLLLEVPRQAELAEREEEVHLGDTELDVPAGRRDPPRERRAGSSSSYAGSSSRPEHADLVDPAAEVRRDGDVGRDGDDPLGELRRIRERSSRIRPTAAWVEIVAGSRDEIDAGRGSAHARPGTAGRGGHARRRTAAPRGCRGRTRPTRVSLVRPVASRSVVDLLARQKSASGSAAARRSGGPSP